VYPYNLTNSWRPWGIYGILICVFIFISGFASEQEQPTGESDDNAKCYVCHSGLQTEDIARDHAEMGITCDECHGTSTEHMHDEMLMTEPDLLFGRAEVQKMCSNPSCHKPGEGRMIYGREDHKDQAKVEEFFEKWKGRNRPNGRVVSAESVCTDCHGTHNLNKAVDDSGEQKLVSLFNSKDLEGWTVAGKANWVVKSRRIIAKQRDGEGEGTLWSDKKYGNYELAVTFRAEWPIHAGIYVRGEESNPGLRVEICNDTKTGVRTGSIMRPDRGLMLINFDEELVDKESWNTISIKAQGRHITVWLNAEKIGSIRSTGPLEGHIGLYMGVDSLNKNAELTVREVVIQEISEEQ